MEIFCAARRTVTGLEFCSILPTMKNFPWRQYFIAALFCAVFTLSGRADSVSLNPVADASAYEHNSTFNLGGMSFVPVGTVPRGGRSRGLFRFDVSSVPSNATINSVSLQVTVVRVARTAQSANHELHRLLQSWGEGDKSGQSPGIGFGAPATTGEATWDSRKVPTGWATPGGQAGVDFVADSSSSVVLGNSGQFAFGSTAAMIFDVQSWMSDPNSNFGWMMICSDESRADLRWIGAKEDAANAATLVINYTLPPPPPGIVTTSPLAPGIYAMPYSQTLVATGGTPGYTWSVVTGAVPGGLGLNSASGVLSGTPSAAGAFNFTARATDSLGAIAEQPYSLTIAPLIQPTMTNLFQNSGQLVFSFNGIVGQSYGIEFRDRFTSTNLWATLTNLGIRLSSGSVQITNTISGGQRFYRVRTP